MSIKLYEISVSLPKGMAIKLDHKTIMAAIQATLPAFPHNPARESDVKPFVEKIERNWGILLNRDCLTDTWTMSKPII
jgi:hypothetical protein